MEEGSDLRAILLDSQQYSSKYWSPSEGSLKKKKKKITRGNNQGEERKQNRAVTRE